jgi:hypothetical protein
VLGFPFDSTFGPSFWLNETLSKRWVQKEIEENVVEKRLILRKNDYFCKKYSSQ